MGTRATRHNGRSGKAGHNDRSFNVENADHIEQEMCDQNVYWDCYQGLNVADENGVRPERELSFDGVEMKFYEEKFGDSINAQNERHKESRHTERIRDVEDVLKDPKTCPEETIYQLGTKDGYADPQVFTEVVTELIDRMEKLYGSNYKCLNWALHMDESTPHIHERHVFFADDSHGMMFPKQDKACAALGFERPNMEKSQGKYNNRKMSFDQEVRNIYIEIAEKHGVIIEKVPLEGKEHLEKNDFIIAHQHEQISANEDRISEQMVRISDVDKLIDDITDQTYDKACEVVTAVVRDETQKADLSLLKDVEKKMSDKYMLPTSKNIVSEVFAKIRQRFNKARDEMLAAIKKTLSNKEVKKKNLEIIKNSEKESIHKKIARAKQQVQDYESSRDQNVTHSVNDITKRRDTSYER